MNNGLRRCARNDSRSCSGVASVLSASNGVAREQYSAK